MPHLSHLLLTVIAGLPVFRQPQPAQAQDSVYHALLARLKARDTTVDITARRLSLTKSKDYAPYGSDADAHRDSMRASLQRRDFRRALGEGDSALAVDYLDVRTHVLRGYAAEQLGDTASALWDRMVGGLVVRSIARSGSGTADSPYVIISVSEEYALLRMTGYDRGQQGLGKCGNKPCDILEATERKTGAKRTFYFDISLPKTYLDRLFQSK